MTDTDDSPLSRAVQALAETTRLRIGRPPQPQLADPAQLAQLVQAHRLPAVYTEYLRAHSSADLFDIGLHCGGVSCELFDVAGFAEGQLAYTGQAAWPAGWIVIAIDHEACYVLDLDTVRDGDGAVYRIDHSSGNTAIPVAPNFVGLLERIAADSREPDPLRGAQYKAPPGDVAPPSGAHTLLDRILGFARIAGVIAVSAALVLGAMALLAWLLRACTG